MQRIQQKIKWVVYTLLIVNFAFYILGDWTRATHKLSTSSGLLDWSNEFATSIDELAWFILLFMFELETYVLEDRHWRPWVGRTVHAVRLLCYVLLAHTVYALTVAVGDLRATVPVADVANLCDIANTDISFVYNLEYTEITEQTCGGLSDATEYFWVSGNPVVSDLHGLRLERVLSWVDLAEAITWLLVIATIEFVVRLQNQGIAGGAVVLAVNRLKTVFYAALIAFGVYWASLSHWLYLWDELVWILGFAAIEMNVNSWREELQRGTNSNGDG